MAGISIGYVYALTEKFALEAFVGGGTIQSFYKGYDSTTGVRYEDADKFNKSVEWTPYRGGVNLIWKIWSQCANERISELDNEEFVHYLRCIFQ